MPVTEGVENVASGSLLWPEVAFSAESSRLATVHGCEETVFPPPLRPTRRPRVV